MILLPFSLLVVCSSCLCFGEQNGVKIVKKFPTLLIIGEQNGILFK